MQQSATHTAVNSAQTTVTRLSYKFQRLREQIRSAILAGEFAKRLPGERELGRRFGANAKTINKALCDLSGEGLLVRRIGRGTFIASEQAPENIRKGRRFATFIPAHGAESQLQRRIFDAVSVEAAAASHKIARISHDAERNSGSIVLHDWPITSRREAEGILTIPSSALGGCPIGHADASLWLEARRRRIPIVSLGAQAPDAKCHAVVPDFVDAGYQLAEHLFLLGCGSVVAVGGRDCREAAAVANGCRTAADRHHGRFESRSLRDSNGNGVATLACVQSRVREAAERAAAIGGGPSVGMVLIGIEAFRFARSSDALLERWRQGEIAMVVLLDPGDTLAADMAMTSYEVPVERIAAWGVRLLVESTPGERPIEVLIPGELKIRNTISPEAPRATASHDALARWSANRERASDSVIKTGNSA